MPSGPRPRPWLALASLSQIRPLPDLPYSGARPALAPPLASLSASNKRGPRPSAGPLPPFQGALLLPQEPHESANVALAGGEGTAAGCWQTPRPVTQPGGPTLPQRLGVGGVDSVPSMACSSLDWVWVPRKGRDWGQELARLPEAMHGGSLVPAPHKRPALHGTERPRCCSRSPAPPRNSGFLGRQSSENVGSPTVPGLHRDVPALGGGEPGPHHRP